MPFWVKHPLHSFCKVTYNDLCWSVTCRDGDKRFFLPFEDSPNQLINIALVLYDLFLTYSEVDEHLRENFSEETEDVWGTYQNRPVFKAFLVDIVGITIFFTTVHCYSLPVNYRKMLFI